MTDPKVKEVPAVDKVKEETAAPAPEAAAATSSKRKETPPVKGEDDDGDKDDGRPKREKRARKSADVFAPDNFRAAEKQSKIPDGRGTALGDFPEVRASVEAAQLHSAAVVSTYRLLVGRKPGKKDRTVKATILSFRGFLLIKPPQTDDAKQLALDEAAEVCTFLCIDEDWCRSILALEMVANSPSTFSLSHTLSIDRLACPFGSIK